MFTFLESCLRGKFWKNHDIDIAILVDLKIYHVLDVKKPYGYGAEYGRGLDRIGQVWKYLF